MTETSLCHSLTTISDKYKHFRYAYESCGRQLPFTESKIVDPLTGRFLNYWLETESNFLTLSIDDWWKGQIQALNQDGELHVRGIHVIKKYWDEPEKSAEAIDSNGW